MNLNNRRLEIEGRPGPPIGTVSYLLTDPATGAWAMVDPGESILDTFADRLAGRNAPAAILITHGHFDHIGGVAEMLRRWPGTPVWAHPESAPMLESPALNGSILYNVPCESSKASHHYREGDAVALGGSRLRVIETPGHCPGSVSLLCGPDLIAGDVLFQGSVGRWDLPGADYETLAASIRDKLMRLPDATAVYPGHGSPTTIGDERRSNPIVARMLAGEAFD